MTSRDIVTEKVFGEGRKAWRALRHYDGDHLARIALPVGGIGTGTVSLEAFYDELRVKTLIDFARPDGLISVDPGLLTPEMAARLEPHFAAGLIKCDIRDVVDWPPGSFTDGGTGERDNHEMRPVNTVVNAFHAHTLRLMAKTAGLLGRDEDRAFLATRADTVAARINEILFDADRGVYIDGEGSNHASLHSNMFMLAFDLVPAARKPTVLAFVKSRGMACSVYGAQHLLDALYQNGEADYAYELMTAKHDRGWWNMMQAGSTMTLEAWDVKFKQNLDWNHAWGAAPANIVGRHLLGVRPLQPGFTRMIVQPQPGPLEHAAGAVPTPHGPVEVAISNPHGTSFELELTLPGSVAATVGIPIGNADADDRLMLNGQPVAAERHGKTLFLSEPLSKERHLVKNISHNARIHRQSSNL